MTTKKIIYEVNNLLISIENKSNSEQPISIFYPAINRFKENNSSTLQQSSQIFQ